MIVEVRPTTVRHQTGTPVAISVHIENVRNVIAGVSVLVLGADPDWVELTEPTVSLFPGEARTVEVSLLLPEAVPAGQRQIIVQVSEISEPQESVLVPVTVEVPGRERLLLALKPPLVRGGSQAQLSLRAENQGNTVISRPLHGQDDEARLRFTFTPDTLRLAPGEQARVSVKVGSRRPFWGVPMPRMLTVHADARTPAERDAGAPLPGVGAQAAFLQRPRVTRAALSLVATPIVLIIVLVTAVVVVGAILKHHETELENKDSRLVAVSDPDSHSPPTAACPCSLAGRVASAAASDLKATAGATGTAPPPGDPAPSKTPAAKGSGVQVSLYPAADPVTPVASVTAGTTGDWRLDNLSPGDYLVRVAAPRRIPTWYPQAVDAAHATAVTVSGGLTRLRPMVIGVALGSITIALDLEDPSDVRVTVQLGPGSAVPGAVVATAVQTDTPSVFRAENVPTPGHFVVVAKKEGYLAASVPVDLALGQQRDVDTLSLRPSPVPATAPGTATAAPSPSPTPLSTTPVPATSSSAPTGDPMRDPTGDDR
jgi:hypothetical protein